MNVTIIIFYPLISEFNHLAFIFYLQNKKQNIYFKITNLKIHI
ncbi:hypothetical protein DDB_G0289559 [Dictyostelium discoideum AX4]|nr:hypothetical protein DDB_G0289559 [Dictyostelium discoideum AX4]EAL62665.1 hypothetical protein DDB_G0289559 [Dictyostelium discoideum AX4]|eukprot:XP_636168.1 hypothetical protein DDB_G0289559 [Dictyostelium discoideum AX4]